MSNATTQPEIIEQAVQRGHGLWVYLMAGLGLVGCVFLVVKLLDEPDMVVLTDDLTLSEFVWVSPAGAWLGVDVELPRAGGRAAAATRGVVVSRVLLDSPAQIAGVRAGDAIVAVDGEQVDKPAELSRLVAAHKPGETVRLDIERGGRAVVAEAVLGRAPLARLAAATVTAAKPWLGVDLQPVNDLMVQRLGLPDKRGVIVSYVHPGSPAAAAGLRQGDVIRRSGDARLGSVGQLDGIVSAARPGDPLQLAVWRAGRTNDVRVVLTQRPPRSAQRQPVLPEAEVEVEAAWLGLDIAPLSAAEARELGLARGLRGMVVEGVAPGPGVEAGFLAGDVIVAVNGQPTPSITSFKEATEGAVGALVDVVRFGRHIYLSVPAPDPAAGTKGRPAPVRQVAFGLR